MNVGTGKRDAKGKVKEDHHPEYTADEYLVLTQAPDRKDSDTAMIELREPGKTGTAGWQEEQGCRCSAPAATTTAKRTKKTAKKTKVALMAGSWA